MDLRSLINIVNEAEVPGSFKPANTNQAAQPQDPAKPKWKIVDDEPKSAEWTPTPEQEKWLGGANRQDPNILSRMPGNKPPVSYFTDPADQTLAKQLGFPSAATQPASGQGQQPAKQKTAVQQKIEKLNQLVDKLVASRQALAATSAPTATPGQAAQPASATPEKDGTFTYQKKDGTVLKLDANGKILSETAIAKDLVESFGYQYNEADLSMKQLGAGVASGAAKAGLAKAGAKTAAKLVPGAGSALSAMDAYNRWKEGDRTGAVIAALAGAGWLVPGPMGWVLGGSLDAANIARDMSKDSEEEKPATVAQAKTADPKILALQKFLKSQGADLGTTGPNKDGIDGVMGPRTRGAMDSVGLSESQRAQLDQILSEAGLGTIANIGKNFVSGLKGGGLVQPMVKQARGGAIAGKAATGARTALKTGQAIGKHPYAATAGAAGLAGYGVGSAGSDSPTSTPVAAAKPTGGAAAQPTKTAQPSNTEWTDEQKELNRQIKDIAQDLQLTASNDPEVKAALDAVGKKMAGINQISGQAQQPTKEPEAAPTKGAPSLSDFASKIGTYK